MSYHHCLHHNHNHNHKPPKPEPPKTTTTAITDTNTADSLCSTSAPFPIICAGQLRNGVAHGRGSWKVLRCACSFPAHPPLHRGIPRPSISVTNMHAGPELGVPGRVSKRCSSWQRPSKLKRPCVAAVGLHSLRALFDSVPSADCHMRGTGAQTRWLVAV